MNSTIEDKINELRTHPLYAQITDLESLKIFMKFHVFAVWDFMSLLKSLQIKVTSVTLPWTPSTYDPELVHLVNEITLGEESDTDQHGNFMSHFELYIKAMDEIQADSTSIKNFISSMNSYEIPNELFEITNFHLNMAKNSKTHEIAAAFFYGREKIIPLLFDQIVQVLEFHNLKAPSLLYYLKRHIEVDSQDHGPKAQKCLEQLIGDSDSAKNEAYSAACNSLNYRKKLWDFILNEIQSHKSMSSNQSQQSKRPIELPG